MLGFGALGQYALGQVSIAGSPNLTGVAGTGTVGTIVASVSVTLSGVAGTGGVGSISGSVAVTLTGVGGTGAIGTLTATVDDQGVLTGVAATGAVGSIVSAVSVNLSGVFGSGAVGTFTPSGTAASSGVYGTGAVGTIVASIFSPALSGVAGTGAVGTITLYIPLPITRRLTLSNVLRRLRLLGNWTAGRARNMYVGRDFDPANTTENEVYSLDFVNELATGETLSSVTTTSLTVFQGTDANPSSHLSGGSSITGSVVSQRITGLTAGVTYTLAFTVLTNMTNTITLFSRVACRPVQ